ncbi:MAG TPA: beta-ketoacyl synthase N-terminal-like domain-containing protein, partial [Streptosporangiaceae bacterium]
AVASIGGTPEEIFSALCDGTSGVHELRAFDLDRFHARHAYEIDDRSPAGQDAPGRATKWLCRAIGQALSAAGMPHDLTDIPVLAGSTFVERRSAELWWRDGARLEPADLFFDAAIRSAFGAVRTYTPASACAASLYALGMATDLIALDQADIAVVAGADSIPESAFGMMDRVQNQIPYAVLPLDRARRGMLMGEGAAAIVLKRSGPGQRPAARVLGVGMNCDGEHPTKPSRDGIARVTRDAHDRAGVRPADVDLVMLHGTGTQLNDETELAALRDVFEDAPALPYVTAIKSMTGHTSGGSGLLSLIMGVLAMNRGMVPAILGLTDPIEGARGFKVPAPRPATAQLQVTQVNAVGLGGLNAVAIVSKAAA